MVIDNKGKLPLHLVGQSASQKNRAKSDDIKKLLKSKMPEDDDEGMNTLVERGVVHVWDRPPHTHQRLIACMACMTQLIIFADVNRFIRDVGICR